MSNRRSFPTVAPAPPPASSTTVNVPQGPNGAPQLGRWTQTVQSDVRVPLEQAFWGGVMIASTLTIVAGLVVYVRRIALLDAAPVMIGGWLLVWFGAMTVIYFLQLRAVQRTWWSAELLLGRDLTGDGVVGEPGKPVTGFVRTHVWSDEDKRDAEALKKLRFEEFIGRLYRAGKTDTETIRALGFSEAEREAFIAALRDANVIRATRKGNAAGWVFLPQDAEACIALTRKRVMVMTRAAGVEA